MKNSWEVVRLVGICSLTGFQIGKSVQIYSGTLLFHWQCNSVKPSLQFHISQSTAFLLQGDIEAAIQAIKKSLIVCNKQRRKISLFGSFSSVASKSNYSELTVGKEQIWSIYLACSTSQCHVTYIITCFTYLSVIEVHLEHFLSTSFLTTKNVLYLGYWKFCIISQSHCLAKFKILGKVYNATNIPYISVCSSVMNLLGHEIQQNQYFTKN